MKSIKINETESFSHGTEGNKSKYVVDTIDSETGSLPSKFKHIMPIESILVLPWKKSHFAMDSSSKIYRMKNAVVQPIEIQK